MSPIQKHFKLTTMFSNSIQARKESFNQVLKISILSYYSNLGVKIKIMRQIKIEVLVESFLVSDLSMTDMM